MKVGRVIRDASLVLLTMTLIPAAIFAVYSKASFLVVTSRSMEPTINAGDMVITRAEPRTAIETDEIVVLPVPEDPRLRYSHRVVSAEDIATGTLIKTRGDANPEDDAWTLRVISDEVPKVIAVIPTAAIFNGPISRRTMIYSLFTFGIFLFGLGISRLVRSRIQSM